MYNLSENFESLSGFNESPSPLLKTDQLDQTFTSKYHIDNQEAFYENPPNSPLLAYFF